MAAKKGLPDRVQLKGLDELFGINQEQTGQVLDVPVKELFPFQNHPFKVLDDEKMQQTVDSIRENGILSPIMVRERAEGGYEVISGHRRKHAAELLGMKTVPVIIREMSDDEATIAMVDANLQREEILPSEKAFAYKMKLQAISHQGKIQDTSRQVVGKQESADIIGKDTGESGRQIQRYIRLTELLPELLDMVDKKKIKFNPAVELSYLSPEQQSFLLEVIKEDGSFPSLSQAQQIKRLSQDNSCTKESIRSVLTVAGIKDRNVVIRQEVIMRYFSADTSDEEIERIICRLLEERSRKMEGI